MISRRNIRVKVMQTLYVMMTQENPVNTVESQKILLRHFNQTRSLFVYFLYFLTELAGYAQTDARHRSTKHLPTYEDLNVNTKISNNELIRKLQADAILKEQFDIEKPELILDKELVRKIYYELTETSTYRQYIITEERDKVNERKIVEFIINDMLLANETFVADIEDKFSNWDDDGEMVVQLIAAYLQKPFSLNIDHMIGPDKELFAKDLLKTVLEKNGFLQGMIIPKLKNWDPERIALLDMILMKMGVAEFLYFETIPPKVTINEYIDLAKDYSTSQSGQFVNGILDNIHKELVQQGKLHKVDYKKV
ncbi:MAG: transcription antitermination factor NusB [Bacteroidetes bacterium]|nr:transcription antitermination factor NusB [Bacteroidota bacterium]MBS1632299.1 transcription antitermination factor NusB [Bacteroidota bacterium]